MKTRISIFTAAIFESGANQALMPFFSFSPSFAKELNPRCGSMPVHVAVQPRCPFLTL